MRFSFTKVKNIAIFTLIDNDVESCNFGLLALEKFNEYNLNKVIFDFSKMKFLQHYHTKTVQESIELFTLNSVECVVCGFDPLALSIAIHFMDDFSAQAFLNIDKALDALQ